MINEVNQNNEIKEKEEKKIQVRICVYDNCDEYEYSKVEDVMLSQSQFESIMAIINRR